ncbi:DUF4062 domain-containing protein [Pseudomonas sp.]|uniref:DUF4062 domain-containing protein n=1 Tax=Pseudomonas sp. TaxID=306 RepID=UPI0026025DBB|nr:DUF4062 domain-containing protein [Pseudomonas sp.]
MDKRYQVFVSSTYVDLKEERQKVNQTLMEMDCIPAGMELFPATDEEQWEFIKKIIDDCDYYLLIIGGRYGSLSSEGISYTEQEFDYAVERGIRVVALVHGSPGELPSNKTDVSDEARRKLDAFRVKVSTGRLVKYWENGNELPGLVSLSLTKTIKAFPAVGWVRASEGSSEQLLKEINELRKENDRLNLELSQCNGLKKPICNVANLAGFDDEYTLHGSYWNGDASIGWVAKRTWGKIFYYISPYLKSPQKESAIKEVLLEVLCRELGCGSYMSDLQDQDFQTVAIQMQALGVVEILPSNSAGDVVEPMWGLTVEGERLMVELRAIKKKDV